MKVLITGIHGFVGKNLTKSLCDKHQIFGVDIVTPEQAGIVKTYSWDALEAGVLPSVDVMIHLAGKAHDTKNTSDAASYFEVNTELTKRMYDYFLASTATTFLFFSSVKAAADEVKGDSLTEDVVPEPKGPYGESKIQAETYLLNHLPELESGKKVYILRPCMIHGPGNKGNLNLLYKVVQSGFPWPLGAFENRRSFTSIDNLCFVVEGLLAGTVDSGIYHMADDEALSTNELITVMSQVLGKKPRIWKLPQWLMKHIAADSGLLHLPLNPERLRKLTENYVVSNVKLKKALGIETMPVTAKEGLIKTINAFQKSLSL